MTSRPVKMTPEIKTSSPTFNDRTVCSEMGIFSSIISVEPGLDRAIFGEDSALAPIGPAHIADADEKGGGQAIDRANLDAQQGSLAAETHWSNAKLVGGA